MSIPTVDVRGTYLMDPQTEDLIWGDDLKDGMVVLIEDELIGRSSFGSPGPRDLERIRWCEVSKLRREGHLIRFIGIYADGSKFSRTYNESFSWFVKKDSIAAVSA